MLSIKNNINNINIVNKSKFISFLFKINNIDDINNILNCLRSEYKDSTHICYGYIINGIEKSFDDGEPRNSAGKPILESLKKNKLNFILAVVIRYYGGTKLGIGNLTRTYKNCISELIKSSEIIELIEYKNISISINYSLEKIINSILNNIEYSKIYNEKIEYNLNADDNLIDNLNNIDGVSLIVNNTIYIEKPITK
ncbi:MAG: YigZ family protein [Bacilli bacterium]|nr:YigZ family protein [Bacilli bacterium]